MLKKFIIATCISSLALFAQNNQQTLAQKGLVQEISQAPDGVTIRLAEDGSFQVFSVATAAYNHDDVDDILAAQKEATLKAKAAIAKFMNESLNTEESFKEASKQIKKISSKDSNVTTTVNKDISKKLLLSIKNSASALLKGVIVISSAKIPANQTSGTYKVMLGVSSKTLTVATKLNNSIGQQTEQQAQISTTSNKTPLPEGWVECIGEGKNRKEAVIAALVEGVQQVYGLLLKNNSSLAENIEKFKDNSNNISTTITTIQNNTFTATFGLIKEFRIIEEISLDKDKVKVIVHAHIIKPRLANTISLLVYNPIMDFDLLTQTYTCGPKKEISGSNLIKEVHKALTRAFVETNKYSVSTNESLTNVIKQQKNNLAMVSSNLSPSSELLKFCQILTCDYILTSKVEELKYSRVTTFNRKTNKFAPSHNMLLVFNYKITNVTTGKIVANKEISVSLTNEEISNLLDKNPNSNLLRAIINKAVNVISTSIPNK